MENFFRQGRMISDSKSGYCNAYPDHFVIFNANLCTKSNGKVWHGDLTLDELHLIQLRNTLEEDILILSEMDARFENEANPKLEEDKAIARVTKNDIMLLKS